MERRMLLPSSETSGVGITFIGGTGRSGTTVLKRALGGHPHVATSPFELRILTDPDGVVDFYNAMSMGWSPYLFDRRVRRLESFLRRAGRRGALRRRILRPGMATSQVGPRNGRFRSSSLMKLRSALSSSPFRPSYAGLAINDLCPDYDLRVDLLMDRLIEYRYLGRWSGHRFGERSNVLVGPPSKSHLLDALAEFGLGLFGSIANEQEASHFVEDSPFNLLSFDRLVELMPRAKLIHVYRDPRDVVASLMKQAWGPSDPVMACVWYRKVVERWNDVRRKLSTDTFMEVKLESIVEAPQAELESLLRFMGVGWDSSMKIGDWSRANQGRWRRDLAPSIQELLMEGLASQVEELGYEQCA